MQLLFRLDQPYQASGRGAKLGVTPNFCSAPKITPIYYSISGVTRDSAGTALGLCEVHLMRTADDVEMEQKTSDANGNFEFRTPTPANNYYLVAYLAGSPDVFGTTVNTLTAV